MPALRPGIPFADYLKIEAVNWSKLKWMDVSPLHYHHHLHDPDDHDTPARRLGRATHTLALDPARFEAEYAVFDGERRAGAEWKSFAAANADRDILKANELDEAHAIAHAVQTHPVLAPYREGARYEMTATWTDKATGLRCKARPDWLVPGVLLDLKTTTTLDGRRFGNLAARMGYHCQLAHYKAGVEACGHPVDRVVLVAVESAAPYDVAVFELDGDALQAGREKVDELLARLAECQASGQWPGRYEAERALELPFYVFADDNDAEDLGVSFNEETA